MRKIVMATAALWLAATSGARAGTTRYGLIIGDDHGDRDEVTLRYAESDARRIAEVLESVGGFDAENLKVLTAARADDVRRALVDLNNHLRQNGRSSMLFVFYSGHADAEALHLNDTRFGLSELRDLTAGAAADERVLVVDSCRSGALTRVKGGRSAQSFEIPIDVPAPAQGMAILTSSAAGEDSQESDELKASIFTHHLVSALLGAADRDDDGRITIDEAFRYASQRTIATTVSTISGPQHPTYRIEMGGRTEVALTVPRSSGTLGQLSFVKAGSYLVQRNDSTGPIVAEVMSDRSSGHLTVSAGRYFVTERAPDQLREASFAVASGETTPVNVDQMQPVAYTRVSKKGDCEPTYDRSFFVRAANRAGTDNWHLQWGGTAGERLDYPLFSLELAAGITLSHDTVSVPPIAFSGQAAETDVIHSYEMDVSVAALHVFSFRHWSAAAGLKLGAAWFRESSTIGFGTSDMGGMYLGPLVQATVPISRRFYASAAASLEGYFVHGMHFSLWPRSAVQTALGAGARF